VLAQFVQFVLVFSIPAWPALVTVNMDSKPGNSCLFQLPQRLDGKLDRIGQDDGLDAVLGDEGDGVHDLGMNQRLAPGNGDVVRVAPLFEEANLVLDLLQRFVAGQSLAVTSLTGYVAYVRHLQPRDGIVIHGPGQAVEVAFVERHRLLLSLLSSGQAGDTPM
jgi:hypothetical protein